MKCLTHSTLILVAAFMSLWWVPVGAVDLQDKGMALMKEESFNELRLDMKEAEVLKLLGKPGKKGKDIEWEAIGEFVQEWEYPEQGISLNMVSLKKGGAKTVFSATVKSPSAFKTRKGIQIGATEDAVKKAYGQLRDGESSEAGKTFVMGSLYGGLVFTFAKGKVDSMFMGALAD